jgi:hypothetical protein
MKRRLWELASFSWGLSLGLQKVFLFRGSGWDSRTEPREVEVEEKGLWKWGNTLYGSSFRGTWKGAPLSGALKVMKGRLWE